MAPKSAPAATPPETPAAATPRAATRKKKSKAKQRSRAAPAATAEPVVLPPTAQLPSRVQQTFASLKHSERLFVYYYTGQARGNVVLAARLAKLAKATRGRSGKVSEATYQTLSSLGCQLMLKPQVRAAIDAWYESFNISAATVTASIADMASINMGPFVQYDAATEGLKVKVPDEDTWLAHQHWVKRVKMDPETGNVVDLELHDSLAAKRDLAKILRLTSDAPIIGLFLTVQQMTDEEILRELAQSSGQLDMPVHARIGNGEVVSVTTAQQQK